MTSVTVWHASVRGCPESAASVLSEAERHRLREYRNAGERRRFLAGAVLLRGLAGRQLDRAPGSIRVDRSCPACAGHHGRPSIADVSVSVSHTGDRVAVALGHNCSVGIDVECRQRGGNFTKLVPLTLTVRERHEVERLQPPARRLAFLDLWTAKEAVLKALGVGLNLSPRRVEVRPGGCEFAVVDGTLEARLRRLDLGAEYVATLAILPCDQGQRAAARR